MPQFMPQSYPPRDLMAQAECLFDQQAVEAALQNMAQAIERDFSAAEPVVIGVMQGALVTLGYLLPRLGFPLTLDYVHATRYQQGENGGDLGWKRRLERPLDGRRVLLVDDILDQGITLAAIAEDCRLKGAADVRVAVLAEKHLANYRPPIQADYRALLLPDRFVFGYGMDYQGYWRNAPGIYAL